MGKKQEQASLVEDLEQELADTKHALEEANQRAVRAARDVGWYAARETARMQQDHNAKQAKLREAERKERYERIENIGAGLLPLKHATDWAIINEDGESGLQVFVPLSVPEQRAVQDYLNKPSPIATTTIRGINSDLWEAALARTFSGHPRQAGRSLHI